MGNPVLSIGIIFKNDIRCIERCLKALQPLRDVLPCELVMADTGSDDGSREVAEKYADQLIDFPWIDDFAAARNAVIDRCSGDWYLSVDTDEYLDEFGQLLELLTAPSQPYNLYRVNIRNYGTYEMDGDFSDFFALRLFRMSFGLRYEGAIHEHLVGRDAGHPHSLTQVIFKHDGYVGMGGESGKGKRDRNMTLLRDALKKDPKNLLTRLQIIESGMGEKDYLSQLRKAVALVKDKIPGWHVYGPPIMRYAVTIAHEMKLEEFKRWLKRTELWFPQSYFTRIDVAYLALLHAWHDKDYEECIRRGEALRGAYADFRAGKGDLDCQALSPLKAGTPYFETITQIMLACSYQETDRPEIAVPLLEAMDYNSIDAAQAVNLVKVLCVIHSQSWEDTDRIASAMWEGFCLPTPNTAQSNARKAAFLSTGAQTFLTAYREEEAQKEKFTRPAYAAFLPLSGKCTLGTAAAILESRDAEEIAGLLSSVEAWGEFPASALAHVIDSGVVFPLPGQPTTVEDLDGLAVRLSQEKGAAWRFAQQAARAEYGKDWKTLVWTRALVLSAVQSCKWEQEEQGMELAKAFVAVEDTYLSRCYVPEILTEENLFLLPVLHRFAWYCVRAFQALDEGNTAGYVRLLRKGLTAHEGMKPMVEFLTEHTPELQVPEPDPELLDLAGKVRDLLALYPQDDPAVVAIKASDVYKRVAHLIEEP